MLEHQHTTAMKIGYLIDTIATGAAGTQKQLLETIRRLDKREFAPELICLWESPWMRENPLPCPLTVLGYRGFLKVNFPSVVRRLAAVIDAHGIDVIQTFFEDSIFVAALGAAHARTSPVLLSSRRDIGLGAGRQPWYHRLFRAALPVVNRRFRGIVANCEQVRQYVARRERTPVDKIKVVYNGVTLPTSAPAPIPAVFVEHRALVWIGLAASLTPVKRHDLLIRALASITREARDPPARVLLLGEGPERGKLEQLAQSCGVGHLVHFAGAVTDIGSYLPHLDIGVLCSDREGLSNAILEYMTFGLPVVATEVGGNPELVSAQNGIRVPANDVESLARALSELIADPARRARLGEASLQRVRREFSWERSMSELQAYYRSLARTA
jgi:glycosyltransferase involved in cell wall biosynthesis